MLIQQQKNSFDCMLTLMHTGEKDTHPPIHLLKLQGGKCGSKPYFYGSVICHSQNHDGFVAGIVSYPSHFPQHQPGHTQTMFSINEFLQNLVLRAFLILVRYTASIWPPCCESRVRYPCAFAQFLHIWFKSIPIWVMLPSHRRDFHDHVKTTLDFLPLKGPKCLQLHN